MSKALVLMIIYFGTGKYAQFDTERFDDMAQCSAAKAAIVSQYADTWSRINADDIACVEVNP